MKSNKRIHVQAPAKLNLFLHIISKRKDGYHSLESVFVPISWCDGIDIENTNDDLVTRQGEFVCEIKNDLLYKAANLFKKYTHSHLSNSKKKINASSVLKRVHATKMGEYSTKLCCRKRYI